MKKLFLGLFVAGTMMSFTNLNDVEKPKVSEEDAYQCIVKIYVDGYLRGYGSAETCERAEEIAMAQL